MSRVHFTLQTLTIHTLKSTLYPVCIMQLHKLTEMICAEVNTSCLNQSMVLGIKISLYVCKRDIIK